MIVNKADNMFSQQLLYTFYFTFSIGFEQESYVDQSRKIAAALSGNGNITKDIGVEMTGAGAGNTPDIVPGKGGECILSIASMADNPMANDEGYKILLEQAIYEMHRGSDDIALEYLNKAIVVRTLI